MIFSTLTEMMERQVRSLRDWRNAGLIAGHNYSHSQILLFSYAVALRLFIQVQLGLDVLFFLCHVFNKYTRNRTDSKIDKHR